MNGTGEPDKPGDQLVAAGADRPSSGAAPAPSFLPPDAGETGDGFLEQLAPSLRPSAPANQSANPSATPRTGPPPLAAAQARAREQQQRLETPLSSQSGLISAILTKDVRGDGRDEGALAALRTLPFRRRKSDTAAALRSPALGAARSQQRVELLLHLAEQQSGGEKARLLTAAAELLAKHSHAQPDAASVAERARAAYGAARAADAQELVGLRKQQAAALRARDLERARVLYAAETLMPVSPAELALAHCALAEIDSARGADEGTILASLRAAADASPGSLVPNLLRARIELSAGRRREAAQSLARAAEARAEPQVRALLFMESGRAYERAGDPSAALGVYAQALSAEPKLFGAALGRYRAQRASGAPGAAVSALETLEQATPDARLRGELARKRGRLLREVMGNARAALEALAEANSLPGLREKLRAAEAAGDGPQLLAAIGAWVHAASGGERGLALVELALAQARAGAPEAAESLREAAIAHAPQGLLAMARELMLQRRSSRPPVGSTPPLPDPSTDPAEALRAAARLARGPEDDAPRDAQALVQERAALGSIAPTEPEHALAEVIAFDAAAELADTPALQRALTRELERASLAHQKGPALALLSLLPTGSEQARDLEDDLHAAVRGEPLIGRFLAQRRPPAEAAALWLEEAASSSGGQAAFAAVMAGHLLRAAGQDSIDAYAEALDHVRGYLPACFALELPARQKAELSVLERVHRELATTTTSRSERAGRRARLGLLSADSDLSHAVAWFELAAEDRPDDPLIAELLLRLSSEGSLRAYVERLTQTALLESSPAFARAYRLRAAAALEAGEQWNDAATLYRAILDESPDDVFVQQGLAHALRNGQQWDVLAAQLERRFQLSERAFAPSGLLEEWADVELRRGDMQRAKRVYETLLEQRPSSLVALRGLSRMAMSERDDARLLALSEASLRALERPAERAAELRVCLRLRAWLGQPGGEQLLLTNEDRLESTLWYALMLEAVAIERGDLGHYYQLTHQIAGLLHEPIERAAYALRAAETLEATAPTRALADLESLLLAAPGHPLALPTLARLHRAASSPRAAAEAFVHAAEQAREPERAAELFYAAGVLFEDELRDEARAAAALSRVADIDAAYSDTFQRLRRLLRARGETGALLALLARRALSPIEPGLAAELELERAALFRAAGDRAAALGALRSALSHDPARAEALRGLADLLWDEGQHHKAAEALVQLARLTDDKAALAEVVFQLGSLYDEHLRDPKRAELAFTRAATLAPDDPRPIERLVLLWKRTDQKDRAVRALQHLIANSWSVATKEGYILDLASTLEEMGERALAEQSLEDARRQAPTSMRVLRAQAALYEREEDRTALSLHLQRSCNALRSAIDEEPGEPGHWLNLIELLEKRGRADGAELVVDAAYSCGVTLPDRPRPKLLGLGSAALTESVLRKLVTRGLLDPLRRLFREFHAELGEFLPPFPETSGPLSESQTRAVRAVSELFGLGELQLVGSEQSVCVPISADPLTLCVGNDVFLTASEAERFFLLTRAVVVAKHGLMLLVRAAPERVLLVLHALRTVVRPGSVVPVANEREQRGVTRDLAKLLPPPRHTQLRPLLSDLLATEDLSTRRLAAAAYEFGGRVALTISGNLAAAIEALLRLRGKPPEELDREERLRLLRADPALRALLSFAISEAYLEARREVLLPATKVSS